MLNDVEGTYHRNCYKFSILNHTCHLFDSSMEGEPRCFVYLVRTQVGGIKQVELKLYAVLLVASMYAYFVVLVEQNVGHDPIC